MVDLIIDLIRSVAVVMVVAYAIFHTRLSKSLFEGKVSFRSGLMLTGIFGLFSIYGTLGGVEILGAVSNIRDLGPLIAGLAAGPFVGLGAGLIGGIHRYFMGGFTAVPCALSTLIAGLLGGMIFIVRKGKFPPIIPAMIIAAIMEVLHMGINLLIAKPFDKAFELISAVSLPMILTNSMGIGIFSFILFDLKKERNTLIEQERMNGELESARTIQMSMIPQGLPSFLGKIKPDPAYKVRTCLSADTVDPAYKVRNLDAFAWFQPALEVGGDLYDWMYLDEDHLFFIVGDVAGKGVPAALFMAVTRTLVRSRSSLGGSPSEMLSAVNGELCMQNTSSMFVTLFMGILNLSTRELTYSNAGHPSPYRVKPQESFEPLPKSRSMALGALSAALFDSRTTILKPGEIILLFTDGVTEATDSKLDFYTEARLEKVLSSFNSSGLKTAEALGKTLLNDLRIFVGNAPQADDITIMAISAPEDRGT